MREKGGELEKEKTNTVKSHVSRTGGKRKRGVEWRESKGKQIENQRKERYEGFNPLCETFGPSQ